MFFFRVFCDSSMVPVYLLHPTNHPWVIATFHHEWPNKASAGCDRSREGEKRSVWFPHSCTEEEWGMHQLQTMALYPAQWLTHTNTHTLTNKTQTHTCMHAHKYTNGHTHINFGALVFPLPSWTTTGSLRECVATLCVFVYKLLSSSKQNIIVHTIVSTISSSNMLHCYVYVLISCCVLIDWFVNVGRPCGI